MDRVEIVWDVGPNVPDNILEEIKADLAAGLTPDGLKYHVRGFIVNSKFETAPTTIKFADLGGADKLNAMSPEEIKELFSARNRQPAKSRRIISVHAHSRNAVPEKNAQPVRVSEPSHSTEDIGNVIEKLRDLKVAGSPSVKKWVDCSSIDQRNRAFITFSLFEITGLKETEAEIINLKDGTVVKLYAVAKKVHLERELPMDTELGAIEDAFNGEVLVIVKENFDDREKLKQLLRNF